MARIFKDNAVSEVTDKTANTITVESVGELIAQNDITQNTFSGILQYALIKEGVNIPAAAQPFFVRRQKIHVTGGLGLVLNTSATSAIVNLDHFPLWVDTSGDTHNTEAEPANALLRLVLTNELVSEDLSLLRGLMPISIIPTENADVDLGEADKQIGDIYTVRVTATGLIISNGLTSTGVINLGTEDTLTTILGALNANKGVTIVGKTIGEQAGEDTDASPRDEYIVKANADAQTLPIVGYKGLPIPVAPADPDVDLDRGVIATQAFVRRQLEGLGYSYYAEVVPTDDLVVKTDADTIVGTDEARKYARIPGEDNIRAPIGYRILSTSCNEWMCIPVVATDNNNWTETEWRQTKGDKVILDNDPLIKGDLLFNYKVGDSGERWKWGDFCYFLFRGLSNFDIRLSEIESNNNVVRVQDVNAPAIKKTGDSNISILGQSISGASVKIIGIF